jgi:hypothetical protein
LRSSDGEVASGISMEIVSSQSEQDIARKDAERSVDWAIRELTANLMRISRGAGKSYDVGKQTVELMNSFQEYWDTHGVWPWDRLNEFLAYDRFQYELRPDTELLERSLRRTQNKIVRGSLQMVASDLLRQSTQVAAGETEFFDGYFEREKAYEEERQKRTRDAVTRKSGRPRKSR